jgi:hypothetical protein
MIILTEEIWQNLLLHDKKATTKTSLCDLYRRTKTHTQSHHATYTNQGLPTIYPTTHNQQTRHRQHLTVYFQNRRPVNPKNNNAPCHIQFNSIVLLDIDLWPAMAVPSCTATTSFQNHLSEFRKFMNAPALSLRSTLRVALTSYSVSATVLIMGIAALLCTRSHQSIHNLPQQFRHYHRIIRIHFPQHFQSKSRDPKKRQSYQQRESANLFTTKKLYIRTYSINKTRRQFGFKTGVLERHQLERVLV